MDFWQECAIVRCLVRAGKPTLASSPLRKHCPWLHRQDWSPIANPQEFDSKTVIHEDPVDPLGQQHGVPPGRSGADRPAQLLPEEAVVASTAE